MKHSILYSAITAAMAIGLAACSSGGGDVAGIGGSGVTSSGTVTGFGSVYVNGVKFDTSNSSFSIDDNPGSESDLAVGMRVTVNGTLIDDSNGTATSISFNDDLEGPVSNLADVGNDGLIKTFTLLGRQVRISSDTTSFDISGTVPGPFDFDSIADNNHVEISGFLDANGVMIATRVELKSTNFTHTGTIVEMKGTVENFTDPTFNLANTTGVTIDVSSAVIDNNLPGGIVGGAFVEVKGTCSSGACTTINASKVESGLDDFNDNDDVEVEGVITDLTSQDIFEVNGIAVDASNATRIPTSINLVENQEVEVEGSFNGNTLIATKVKDESNDIKVAATVSNPSFSADSFQVTPVNGQPPITVKIDKSTEIEDESGVITNPDNVISNLSSGDFVEVEGYLDGSGAIIASEFERETTTDHVIVQGIMESFNAGSTVKVLGVEFQVQQPETEYEDENDATLTPAEFETNTQDNVTLIKVKDRNDRGVPGVADEVEIELP